MRNISQPLKNDVFRKQSIFQSIIENLVSFLVSVVAFTVCSLFWCCVLPLTPIWITVLMTIKVVLKHGLGTINVFTWIFRSERSPHVFEILSKSCCIHLCNCCFRRNRTLLQAVHLSSEQLASVIRIANKLGFVNAFMKKTFVRPIL